MFLARKLRGEPAIFTETFSLPVTTAGWTTAAVGTPATRSFFTDAGVNLQQNVLSNGGQEGQLCTRVINSTDMSILPSTNHRFRGGWNTNNDGSPDVRISLFSVPNSDGTGTRTTLSATSGTADQSTYNDDFVTPSDHAAFVLEFELTTNQTDFDRFAAISAGGTQIIINP